MQSKKEEPAKQPEIIKKTTKEPVVNVVKEQEKQEDKP